jgi:hypothetical protein
MSLSSKAFFIIKICFVLRQISRWIILLYTIDHSVIRVNEASTHSRCGYLRSLTGITLSHLTCPLLCHPTNIKIIVVERKLKYNDEREFCLRPSNIEATAVSTLAIHLRL